MTRLRRNLCETVLCYEFKRSCPNSSLIADVLPPYNHKTKRAYYTLRSDASSKFLGFCGARFSHFRKAISSFSRIDDGKVYELRCEAKDSLCSGYLHADLSSLSTEPPPSTRFPDVTAAADFVLDLDGSCGYSYRRDKLSFQDIEYLKWVIQFCHKTNYYFPLLRWVLEQYDIDAELDSVLFMQNVPQTWKKSRLYRLETASSSLQTAGT